MKIIVHDFAGHPFQVQLSCELALRGHQVVHAYFADIPGPKGKLTADCEFPNLTIEPIHITRPFEAYSYVQRMRAHREYAKLLSARIKELKPDVVISGNTPTDAQYTLSRECHRLNIRFVHWVQDFYAYALEFLLSRRLGALSGKLCTLPFHVLERRIFKTSDAVVYISEDFAAYAERENYQSKRSVVIENWASLEDLPIRPKDNAWARTHGLQDKFVFLYSGTMGLKHNPEILLHLARHFKSVEDVRIVLVSQGIGRQYLEKAKKRENLDNLMLLDFQPFSEFPDVLASADVLLATVEAEAGCFSVPSKILSYMCSGRAILMSVSAKNLASRVVTKAGAGFAVDPADHKGFMESAITLYENREGCAEMARNARRYAEATFDIQKIGSIFETVLRGGTEKPAELSSAEPCMSRSLR